MELLAAKDTDISIKSWWTASPSETWHFSSLLIQSTWWINGSNVNRKSKTWSVSVFFSWQWLCPWLRCQPWSVPALSSRGRCGTPGWCHLGVEACTARWNYWERKEQKRKEDHRKGRVTEGGNDGLKRENKVGYRFKVKVNIPNWQSSSQNIPSVPCNEWVILWSLQPCHPLPKGKSGPFKIAKWKATICSAHVANFRVFKCSKLEGKSITLLKSILFSQQTYEFSCYLSAKVLACIYKLHVEYVLMLLLFKRPSHI